MFLVSIAPRFHRGFFISNSILGATYVLSSPTGPRVPASHERRIHSACNGLVATHPDRRSRSCRDPVFRPVRNHPYPNPFRINTYENARKCWALLTSSTQLVFREVDKERLKVFSDGAGGTMAEVGLLPFARVALQVATQVLPPYRTRFSKHQFTQPQLLAVLCLMRYEDWTFREAEVRL